MKFKISDMIECVEDDACYLTKGKAYIVQDISKQGHPYIENEKGEIIWYHSCRFKKIDLTNRHSRRQND